MADRENKRIQCFDYEGTYVKQYHPPEMKGPVYALDYCPDHGRCTAPRLVFSPNDKNVVLANIVMCSLELCADASMSLLIFQMF